MISARDALERLREGNRRFLADARGHSNIASSARCSELARGQEPFAIVLGCSDSRVPPEIIFDQGLGDLFVIRVAGNVVSPSQIGSVEFAAERFGTRLVVVLGHSLCGAVEATLEEIGSRAENKSPNLRAIIDYIRPSVEELCAQCHLDRDALLEQAVRANIRASVDHMRHGSEVLEGLVRSGQLSIVGAEYSLETGIVDWFDAVEEIGQGQLS